MLFDSFHSERRMSFNHWRYRLLHWCFNVENPEKSDLPKYLYSHYCPLFHLTNFIAMFAWLVLMVKISTVIVKSIASVLSNVNWTALWPKTEEPDNSAPKAPPKADSLKKQWAEFAKQVLEFHHRGDFELFWRSFGSKWSMNEDEAQEKFTLLQDRQDAAKERAKVRQAAMKKRVLFWVNFSQAFVKWFLYAFYVCIGAFAIWLSYTMFRPIVSGIVAIFQWLFSIELSSVVWMLILSAKLLAVFGVVFFFVKLFRRFKLIRKCYETTASGIVACSMPFVLLLSVVTAPFVWVGVKFMGVIDFIHVFYEESCPPIIIIDDDEAAMETAIEESVQ